MNDNDNKTSVWTGQCASFHTGQWGTWGKGGDPGGGSRAWDVEFGIAFEVGP